MQDLHNAKSRQRVIETALILLLLTILLAATLWVLRPFVGILVYAIIIATATATPFDKVASMMGGSRKLAATLFVIAAACITIVPLIYLSFEVADRLGAVVEWMNTASTRGIPDLPAWITGLPLVGKRISSLWVDLQRDGLVLLSRYQEQVASAGRWLIGLGAGLAFAVLEIFLGIIIAAVLHVSRASVLKYVKSVAERMVGSGQLHLLDAAGRAIRGVAIGVIGTALLEGAFAWIGFAIAGVPGAVALAAITFFLAVIQLGPLFVWLPVAIWLGMTGEMAWAIFITIWGIVLLMGADNIVKPMLIARSGHLPLLVLFVGVIGGLAAWGFTGMFIGAVTLAVFWTVLQAWLGRAPDEHDKVPA